jgi:hypothetical protein
MSYGEFPALLVEENLMCISMHFSVEITHVLQLPYMNNPKYRVSGFEAKA